MQLCSNQSIADSDHFSSVRGRSFILLHVTAVVLLSAKLSKSEYFSHKKRSLRNVLNRTETRMQPCGTPERIVSSLMQMLNPLFSSFQKIFRVVRRFCSIQSNVFDRSINTAPNIFI